MSDIQLLGIGMISYGVVLFSTLIRLRQFERRIRDLERDLQEARWNISRMKSWITWIANGTKV